MTNIDYYEECLMLRKKVEKYETILKNEDFRSRRFFICGEAGEKDKVGLPEKIMVCPSITLNMYSSYTKDRDDSSPGVR